MPFLRDGHCPSCGADTRGTAGHFCTPASEPVVELALCESRALLLKPDTLYRFDVIPGCEACARMAAEANP